MRSANIYHDQPERQHNQMQLKYCNKHRGASYQENPNNGEDNNEILPAFLQIIDAQIQTQIYKINNFQVLKISS